MHNVSDPAARATSRASRRRQISGGIRGDVVTMECVEKIIKKDWIHPLTSNKLTEKDIIVMQRGGTGYALTNVKLDAKQERPALQA
nr:unnamed protein product [Callosobruchus chinensis]